MVLKKQKPHSNFQQQQEYLSTNVLQYYTVPDLSHWGIVTSTDITQNDI